MSGNVPPSSDILKLLPVKSLVRFRSVSKTWKSLIDSRHFVIQHHTHRRTQPHPLLVMHEKKKIVVDDDECEYEQKYVLVDDDDDDYSFPKYKLPLYPPLLVRMLYRPRLVDTCHGLMCFFDSSPWGPESVVLWNPSIRKFVAIDIGHLDFNDIYATAVGFGVCRQTNDVKVVKITYVDQEEYGPTCIPVQVKVFTLRKRTWRLPYGSNLLLGKPIHFFPEHEVLVDGIFYWLATDRITLNEGECEYMIVSFDITSEEFREIALLPSFCFLAMSKLRESLVVVGRDQYAVDPSLDVWMMEDGCSLRKMFTITPKEDGLFRGFRKSGEPILGNLGIDGSFTRFKVCDYMETLLLLDHPNFVVFERNLNCGAN